MIKLLKGAALVLAAAAVPMVASAQLVQLSGFTGSTGNGLSGSQVLVIQSPANGTVASGCVTPTGTTPCGFTDANVQGSQSSTISTAGITANNLLVLSNFAQPGGGSVTLTNLEVLLYNGNTLIYSSNPLTAPVFFASTGAGTGNAGFFFGFVSGSVDALAFQAKLATATSLGLGAKTSGDVGGKDSFTVGTRAVTATPEPASLILLGTGLVGVFGAGYRRRKNGAA
jgi:hypothetical protein